VDAGDIAGAKETAAQTSKERVGGHRPDYQTMAYRIIAVAQVKAGDLTGARETAVLTDDEYSKMLIFLSIAELQARAGNLVGAIESIADADEVSWQSWGDFTPIYSP